MFGWLIEKIASGHAVRVMQRDPLIQGAVAAINDIWSKRELTVDFSGGFVEKQRNSMMERAIQIAQAPDRRMANREHFASCVVEMAQYQVLVLVPESEAPDVSGLRGCPGVTGELKARLAELAEKRKELREYLHGVAGPLGPNDIWDAVLLRFRLLWAWTDFHHRLREPLEDMNKAPGRDWYRPFLAAMCAWEENLYRQALGMPSMLSSEMDENGTLAALEFSSFLNIVMSGVRYPDLEWRDKHPELVAQFRL